MMMENETRTKDGFEIGFCLSVKKGMPAYWWWERTHGLFQHCTFLFAGNILWTLRAAVTFPKMQLSIVCPHVRVTVRALQQPVCAQIPSWKDGWWFLLHLLELAVADNFVKSFVPLLLDTCSLLSHPVMPQNPQVRLEWFNSLFRMCLPTWVLISVSAEMAYCCFIKARYSQGSKQ